MNCSVHRQTIFFNQSGRRAYRLRREPGTFPTAGKGPGHYPSWEVVAEMPYGRDFLPHVELWHSIPRVAFLAFTKTNKILKEKLG
jgi:hypothetical protein